MLSTIETQLLICLYKDSQPQEPILADHGLLIYQQGYK